MITSIRLTDFKSFGDVTLRFGPFTILVGANATGKSNIRDALRFLHGVARGYTLAEIIGGRYGPDGQQEWEPIRGGPNEIIRMESQYEAVSEHALPAFSIQVKMVTAGIEYIYKIEVSRDVSKVHQFRITYESLQCGSQMVYEKYRSTPDDRTVRVSGNFARDATQSQFQLGGFRPILPVEVDLDRPILPQVMEHQYTKVLGLAVKPVIDALSRFRFLSPSPEHMRMPSLPGGPLGGLGENLPSSLKGICCDRQCRSILQSWVRELVPMDIRGFEFRHDSSERVHFMLRENSGKLLSAYSVSDGTLRFLAMAATLLNNDGSCLYVFEDIERGIYPSRLYLLADLFERNTYNTTAQVLATTHSSGFLNVVNDRTFEHIAVSCRLDGSDASIIRPITDLPNVRKLRTSHGLGRLLSGGWMETTLEFMED